MTEDYVPSTAILVVLIFVIWLYIILLVNMARKRGCNAVTRVFVFGIIPPFWGINALLVLGDSKQKIREGIIEELHRN